MLKATSKLQINSSTLTSIHSDLCKLSLASKIFWPALEVIEAADFDEISKDCAAEPKFILLFYYYGGMVLAAVKVSSIICS